MYILHTNNIKLAVKNNHLSFVNLLLDFGADPNVSEEQFTGGSTPLIRACENNYYEVSISNLSYRLQSY